MSSKLSLGEKLRQVRKSKELSLANIAYDTGLSESTIGRIERGEEVGGNPTPEQLAAIKKALGIPDAPLLDYEVKTYEGRLCYIKELIYTGRLQEAKTTIQDLAVILDLPFEKDLFAILLLLDARLLMMENDGVAFPEEAKKRIDKVGTYLTEIDHRSRDEVLYWFHFNKCSYYTAKVEYKKALEHGLIALNHENTELRADMAMRRAIGIAYFFRGQLFHASKYFEQAMSAATRDTPSKIISQLKSTLATCYIYTNELDKAQKLLEETYSYAKSTNNIWHLVSALLELGKISHIKGNYDDALSFYDQGFLGQKECNLSLYVSGLSYKVVTLIRMKQFDECQKLINEGKDILNTHKERILASDNMLMHFNSHHHRANLKDRNSIDYLENVSIPHYRKVGPKFVALDICQELEEHYKKQRSKMKELAIAAVMRDILMEMMYGEADE